MKLLKPFLFAAGLLSCSAAYAVPAFPGLTAFNQPDGTTIMVQSVGDEWSNLLLSEDGYLLTWVDGALCYADSDADGNIISSGIVATSPDSRDERARAYLSNIDMAGRVLPAMTRRHQRQAAEMNAPRPQLSGASNPGLKPSATFPLRGKQKAIVVLVEFPDQKFILDDPHDYISRMLSEDGFSDYGAKGCAAEWFRDNSGGLFELEFDVFGPITMSQPMAYYGGHDTEKNRSDIRPQKMVIEACQQLDDQVDFREYDRDGDGYIDNVFVFYAGEGENYSHNPDHIWPHAWQLTYAEDTPYRFDGVQLDYYACTNEWIRGMLYDKQLDRPDGIGTFCHEFSHVMGLPDLYRTSGTEAVFTPRAWDVMDSGSYNNESMCPPYYSAFERYAFGWLDPLQLKEGADIRLNSINSNTGCIIKTDKAGEFYMLENRQKTGWDSYIPGHGMLVWHIDYEQNVWYTNSCNNNPAHQYIDIVEADNLRTEVSRAGDSFPGTAGVTSFTDDTTPAMLAWSGAKLNMPVTEIAESDNGVITFKVKGGGQIIKPVTVEVSDVNPAGFTLNWNREVMADRYLVSISTASGVVEGYERRNVGCTTSYEVTGLEPLTDYTVTVIASSDYYEAAPSAEKKISTPAPSFGYERPEAAEATEIAEKAFTANWNSMPGAVDYRLNVYSKKLGEAQVETVDFSDGIDKLPQGWTCNASRSYNNDAYSGKAKPSVRFIDNGNKLQSPMFTEDVRGISFWSRGASARGAVTVNVMALIDGEWKQVDSYVPVDTQGGETYTLEDVPAGIRCVRLEVSMETNASIAVDDVVIEWGGDVTVVPVDGFNAAETGNTTSAKVEGLRPATAYFYTVSGVNADGTVSRASNEIALETLTPAGICDDLTVKGNSLKVSVNGLDLTISGAEGPVTVSTPAGVAFTTVENCVTLPVKGVYIVTDGVAVRKVVVR